MRPALRPTRLVSLAALPVLLIACRSAPTAAPSDTPAPTPTVTATTTTPSPSIPDALVVAAGDIACDPSDKSFNDGAGSRYKCHQRATSDVALSLDPDAVLILGDSQYPWAEMDDFRRSYDPTWGRLKTITRPALGNHEYGKNARGGTDGYFTYFGAAAGERGRGWYSFDVGAWHLIALNSMCAQAGGCDAGSPQGRWLRADLEANQGTRCTLAYWHHPRFSSGPHGNDPRTVPLWRALTDGGAEIVLSGHDHDYERFAPQTSGGGRNGERGIRQFVVGTGGESIYPVTRVAPHSEFRLSGTYGVLALTLSPTSYSWRFVGDSGATLDHGSEPCH